MENIKTINEKLTDEEIKQLEEAKKKPIVFDEDCPETTPERAIKFRRVNPSRRIILTTVRDVLFFLISIIFSAQTERFSVIHL